MKIKSALLPFFAGLFAVTLLLSCEEDEPARKKGVEVRYEVLTESERWLGEYIIETGEKVCNCSVPLFAAPWTHTFSVTDSQKPFELHLDATVDEFTGLETTHDITTNIYVDDVLVASNTSNWTKGVASADYVIEK